MSDAQPDIIVVSDLHLGRGKNQESGRYYELEAFFYDADFQRFCRYLCTTFAARGQTFRLVFNGDTFDLLRLDPVPLPGERDSFFTPVMSPKRAAYETQRVLEGHPLFVDALAQVLREGHEIVLLPGNHDIEVQWAPVQDTIRDVIAVRGSLASEDLARLRIQPWFYYEEGRIWIEHGCQYDPENAFRYPLRQDLLHDSPPETSEGAAANSGRFPLATRDNELPATEISTTAVARSPDFPPDPEDPISEVELDNPLGNFFQRYLYNAFGHITFIVPSTRANVRYMKWLALNQPLLLLRVITSHWLFWWQIIRRVANVAGRGRARLAKAHRDQLNRLAQSSGLGDTLLAIDDLKAANGELFQAIRGFGWQILKFIAASLLVVTLLAALWLTGQHGIQQLNTGFVGKAVLFLTFAFFFLLGALGTALYVILRTNLAVPPQPVRRAAADLARMADVPIVTFGHTHDEVIWRQERRDGSASWYFNTGTWIAVFTHDVLMPRERVQYTYLHVTGTSGELVQWSPGRGTPMPVILLDEDYSSGYHPSQPHT